MSHFTRPLATLSRPPMRCVPGLVRLRHAYSQWSIVAATPCHQYVPMLAALGVFALILANSGTFPGYNTSCTTHPLSRYICS